MEFLPLGKQFKFLINTVEKEGGNFRQSLLRRTVGREPATTENSEWPAVARTEPNAVGSTATRAAAAPAAAPAPAIASASSGSGQSASSRLHVLPEHAGGRLPLSDVFAGLQLQPPGRLVDQTRCPASVAALLPGYRFVLFPPFQRQQFVRVDFRSTMS